MDVDCDATLRVESEAFPSSAAWDVFCLSDLWTWEGPIGQYLSLQDIVNLDAVCHYFHYSSAALFRCWVMKLGEKHLGLKLAKDQFEFMDWMMNSPDAASPNILITNGSQGTTNSQSIPIVYSYKLTLSQTEPFDKLEASYYGRPLGSIIRHDVDSGGSGSVIVNQTIRTRLEQVERYKEDLPSILASSDPLIRMANPKTSSSATTTTTKECPLIIVQKSTPNLLSPDYLYSQWLLNTPAGQQHLHYTMKYMVYTSNNCQEWRVYKDWAGASALHLKIGPPTGFPNDDADCYIRYLYYRCQTTSRPGSRLTLGSLNPVERGMLRFSMVKGWFKPRFIERACSNYVKLNHRLAPSNLWCSYREYYLDILSKHITIDMQDIFTENGCFMSELLGHGHHHTNIVDRWHRQGVDFVTDWYRRIVNGQSPETPPWCHHTIDLQPSWLSMCPMSDMPLILDKSNYMACVGGLLENFPFCSDDTTPLFSPSAFRSNSIPIPTMVWMYNCLQTLQLDTQELINFTTFMSVLNTATLHHHQSYKHLSRDWKLVFSSVSGYGGKDILHRCHVFASNDDDDNNYNIIEGKVVVVVEEDDSGKGSPSEVCLTHIPVTERDGKLNKVKSIVLDGKWEDCIFTIPERRRLATILKHPTALPPPPPHDHDSFPNKRRKAREETSDDIGNSSMVGASSAQYTKIKRDIGVEGCYVSARKKQRYNLQLSVAKDQYPPHQSPLQAHMIMARREQIPLMADQTYRHLFGARTTTFVKGESPRSRGRIFNMTAPLRDYVGIINGHGAVTLDLETLRDESDAKLDAVVPIIQNVSQYKVVLQPSDNKWHTPNACQIDLATGVILFAGGVKGYHHCHLLQMILEVARDPDAYIRNRMQHCFACGIPTREVCACRLFTIRELRQHACRLK